MGIRDIKRRGIAIDGGRLRDLRRARGLKQRELAIVAGVSERTVRNAEGGRAVRLDFARYLAIALGVELVDIAADPTELRVAVRDEEKVARIFTAVQVYAYELDLGELRDLVAPSVRLTLPGPPSIPYVGEYRGVEGMQSLLDFAAATVEHDPEIDMTDIRVGGNIVVMQFIDAGRVTSTQKHYRAWCQYIYEFDKNKIVRIDNTFDTEPIVRAFEAGRA